MPAGRRILQVVQADPGGAPQHVLQLSRGLAERGFAVDVAADPRSGVDEQLRSIGLTVELLPASGRRPGPGDLRVGRFLRALARSNRYDLVHAHSSKSGAIARAFLGRSLPVVYTPHCFSFAAGFSGPERLAYRAVEQALVRRSAAIVVVSEWERRLGALLRGADGRLRLIRNGVPACRGEPPAPELESFRDERPLVGFVSALRAQKDPLAAVRAMAILAERGRPPGRLVIVGDGPLGAKVDAEIEAHGLEADVRLLPFEGGPYRYLRAIDLLVLPSLWESLPLAPLEAMSCGVPVLGTRVGGMSEIVRQGETGELVEPGDTAALAGALGRLLRESERLRSMGETARQDAAQRFGIERMVDRIASLYDELIGARASV